MPHIEVKPVLPGSRLRPGAMRTTPNANRRYQRHATLLDLTDWIDTARQDRESLPALVRCDCLIVEVPEPIDLRGQCITRIKRTACFSWVRDPQKLAKSHPTQARPRVRLPIRGQRTKCRCVRLW